MPKQTFFNLSTAKRDQLMSVIIHEFAEHDPLAASISRIVAEAGIAKGSFYQYFDDKEDVHLYLIDVICRERLSFMDSLRNTPRPDDFFDELRFAAHCNEQFTYSNPELEQVAHRAVFSDYPWRVVVAKRLYETVEQVWLSLVRRGAEQGDIDPAYDPHLVVTVFTTLTEGLKHSITDPLDKRDYFSRFLQVVRLLEFGLRPR